MRVSPFAFFRGSAIVMAQDLARTPSTGIRTQLCGDCHLSNFGVYASPERTLLFDINDFDETLPGPWEWDVKRLVASFYVAGRGNGFSEAECREAVLATVHSYRLHMAEFAAMRTLDVWYSHVTADDLLNLITGASGNLGSKLRRHLESHRRCLGQGRCRQAEAGGATARQDAAARQPAGALQADGGGRRSPDHCQ
jgi:uncharacterized protein (DUF2252 family)